MLLGFLLGIGLVYALGFFPFAIRAYLAYNPNSISPPHNPIRWYETWWGRYIAGTIDGLIWPYHVISLIKDEW